MTHLERVQKAIDYIERHLHDDLKIDELAGIAAFSSWHFQRVFNAMVGQTVACYIRRRRLHSALVELTTTDRKIIDIAWDHRFESQEAFTRAFKAMFGCTPGRCRKEKLRPVVTAGRPRLSQEYLDRLYGGITMQPVIKKLGELKVVGMGSPFISILSPEANNHVVIPQLWDNLMQRMGEISQSADGATYGLCEALPESERSHPDEFYYMAARTVDSLDDIPEGMQGRTVPEGTYAVFTHVGRLNTLGQTMNYIYGSWVPNSGYELRPGPDLELYDERFNPASDTSEMDICIPIKEIND